MKRRFFSIICLFFSILFYGCNSETEIYHTVSFDSNGGSFITAQTIEHGKKVIEPDEPVREGYLFMGWYNGEEKYFFTTLVTSDLVLTAEWKVAINYYNITYSSEYSTAPASIKIAENSVLTSSHLPTLSSEDAIFKGWYVNEKKINAGEIITGDLNLTAKWQDYITVSYSSVFGTSPNSFNIKINSSLTEKDLKNLENGSHIFLGWYYSYDESQNGTGVKAQAGTILKTNTTLYAKWKTATVSFETVFQETIAPITKFIGESLNESEIQSISHIGYSFDGWFNGNNKLTTNYIVSEDITFTAKLSLLTYSINYVLNGGTFLTDAVSTYTVEDNIILPEVEHTDRVFVGWYENADFTGSKISEWEHTEKNGNLTFYAKWNGSKATAETIVETIKSMTESGTIKASGEFNTLLIREINTALKELANTKKAILITLDLSEVTGLTELEAASVFTEYSSGYLDYRLINSSNSFYNCTNLREIILPTIINSIGCHAFFGCSSLKKITIPDSVTNIGIAAFAGCTALNEITLPFTGTCSTTTTASKSTLFGYIFGTSSYTGAVTTKQYYSSSDYQTYYLPPTLTKVVITSGMLLYGTFSNCSNLTDIILEKNVTSIGNKAFSSCSSLSNISIPDSVTSIGNYAFSNCTRLSSISIPDSVTSIGDGAFSSCSSLSSISIPDNVSAINNNTFRGCTVLSDVTIGSSVSKIGLNNFYDCTNLKNITFTDSTTWYYTSSSSYIDGTIINPTEVENAEKMATYLKSTYKNKYFYKL